MIQDAATMHGHHMGIRHLIFMASFTLLHRRARKDTCLIIERREAAEPNSGPEAVIAIRMGSCSCYQPVECNDIYKELNILFWTAP